METIDTRKQTRGIDPSDLHAILIEVNAGIEKRDRKIEELEKELKMEIASADHLDSTLTKRIVDLNRITKELRRERDEYKESIILERIDHVTERETTTRFQNAKIRELKARIEEHESSEGIVIGNLRNINVLLHKTIDERDDTICEMVNEIDTKDVTIDKLNKMYYDSLGGLLRQDNDIDDLRKYRNELEREINTKNKALVDARDVNDTIKAKLVDMEQQANETHELIQDMSSHGWKQANEIAGMKTDRWAEQATARKTIKELKAKLADRERQFNELDAILGRTRNSMLCANEYIGKQNVQIEELKSKLVISDKASKIADEDAEYWWCLHNENHAFIHRLLDGNNTFNGVLDDCRSDVKMLRAQLAAQKKDSDVLKRVVQLVKSWEECHDVKYMHRIHTIVEDRIDDVVGGANK